jgi:hypothetical protein
MASGPDALDKAPPLGTPEFDRWLDDLHRRVGGFVGEDVTGSTDTQKLDSLIAALDKLGLINDKTT